MTPGWTVPYLALADVGADAVTARAVHSVLESVGPRLGARYLAVWTGQRRRGRLRPLAVWPARTPEPVVLERVVPIGSGQQAQLAVVFGADGRPGDADALLDHTSRCVALLLRAPRLEADIDEVAGRIRALEAEMRTARAGMPAAQERERRSVMTEILGISTPRLSAVRTAVARCEEKLAAGDTAAAVTTVGEMSRLVMELAELFRGVVAGAHSPVLRQRGLRPALVELASGLSRRVIVADEDPRRPISAEVSVAAYHLTAIVLRECAGSGTRPVRAELSHTEDELVVTVRAEVTAQDRLRALVGVASGHASALGGMLGVEFRGSEALVRLSLPHDLRPSTSDRRPPGRERPPEERLLAGIDGLLSRALLARAGTSAEPGLRAIAERVRGPVRLGLLTTDLELGAALAGTLLGAHPLMVPDGANIVSFVDGPGTGIPEIRPPDFEPATRAWPGPDAIRFRVTLDNAMARRMTVTLFRTEPDLPVAGLARRAGTVTEADAVLVVVPRADAPSLSPPAKPLPDLVPCLGVVAVDGERSHDGAAVTEEGRAVQLGSSVPTRVLAWSDVLRLRSALHHAAAALRDAPELLAEVERLAAATHELRELDALIAVHRGLHTMPSSLRREAVRLLGGQGRAVTERLGIEDDASRQQVEAAAEEALARWWARGREGTLADTVVRTCEGILASVRSG